MNYSTMAVVGLFLYAGMAVTMEPPVECDSDLVIDPRVLTQHSVGEAEINSDTSTQYLMKLQEHEADIQFNQP
jgi:hypothetical protein